MPTPAYGTTYDDKPLKSYRTLNIGPQSCSLPPAFELAPKPAGVVPLSLVMPLPRQSKSPSPRSPFPKPQPSPAIPAPPILLLKFRLGVLRPLRGKVGLLKLELRFL